MRAPADRSRGVRSAAICLLAGGLAVAPAGARAEAPPGAHEEQIREGVTTLDQGDYEQAIEFFRRGRRAAREAGDSRGEADFNFYLGLSLQRQAQTLDPGKERLQTLDKAARYYERALELRPDSGGALNNLAELYVERWPSCARPPPRWASRNPAGGRKGGVCCSWGINQRSRKLYRRAIALGGDRSAFYAKNYARALETTLGREEAAGWYRKALEARPQDLEAHRALTSIYIDLTLTRLLQYLWVAESRGLIDRVQESALEALESGKFEAEAKEELLTIVVVTLARQYYDPAGFAATATADRLSRLQDEVLEKAVDELDELHRGKSFERSAYGWWTDRGEQRASTAASRVKALRRLSRALGEWQRRRPALDLAESYYRLALTLDERRPDPEALRELSILYFENGRPEEVERLGREYGDRLFEAGETAYDRGDWESIYAYHRTLGVMYDILERSDSTISQLERARQAAARFRELHPGAEPVIVETRLIDLLARTYDSAGRAERSVEVRLEAAERYLELDRPSHARRVLEALERAPEAAALQRQEGRYRSLLEKLEQAEARPSG